MRLLVVEDEAELASALVEALEDEHHAVDLAVDGETADQHVRDHDYDLVILDWKIPAPDGIELLQRWREQGRSTPVLMLSGRDSVHDRVSGLDVGADDYLTKPFAFAEFHARVRSLLRRRESTLQTTLQAGELILDRRNHAVTVDGAPLHLSPKEFGLLEYLLTRKGEVVSREELSGHVWDAAGKTSSNSVDVLVHRLRKKIDGDRSDRLLHTVAGVGYRLDAERQRDA